MILQQKLSEFVECVDGKSYFDGCNNCVCVKGLLACTRKICTGPDGKRLPLLPAPAGFWKQ